MSEEERISHRETVRRTVDEIAITGAGWCTEEELTRIIALARRGVEWSDPAKRIEMCHQEAVCFQEAHDEWEAEKERLEAMVEKWLDSDERVMGAETNCPICKDYPSAGCGHWKQINDRDKRITELEAEVTEWKQNYKELGEAFLLSQGRVKELDTENNGLTEIVASQYERAEHAEAKVRELEAQVAEAIAARKALEDSHD